MGPGFTFLLTSFDMLLSSPSPHSLLRVAAHRLCNFLLMVAMHDYYYCILIGASPLQHKDKVPAKAPLTNFRANLEEISGPSYKTM